MHWRSLPESVQTRFDLTGEVADVIDVDAKELLVNFEVDEACRRVYLVEDRNIFAQEY